MNRVPRWTGKARKLFTSWNVAGWMPSGQGEPFDRFTERARRVLVLAHEEAQRLTHGYIGTEHLLLGLVAEREGVAGRVLDGLGVSLSAARAAVEATVGRGQEPVTAAIGLTPRAKRVLEFSVEEANRLHHGYLGTEHMLLGLIREDEGVGARTLVALGHPLAHVRERLLHLLATGGEQIDQTAAPKGNVVTCRIADGDLDALDALVEAGIRATRSDAAAWLIHAGIESHRPLFERVHATVAEIRRLRAEARAIAEQVATDQAPPVTAAPPPAETGV